jgi:predicted metal-dependent enzyme (double-stranded beta helix superfamily)
MSSESYGIDDYAADLRQITSEESDNAKIVERVRPLAAKLAANTDWVEDKHWHCDEEQGFGVHLLHEEPNHDLAVFAISWLPGRGTLAHDHQTWAVVVGMHGHEQEIDWNRLDDGSKPGYAKLEKNGERVMTKGDIACCLPHHIHTVTNVGEEVSLSLHTYGRHINHTGRSEFIPEENLEKPYIVKVD